MADEVKKTDAPEAKETKQEPGIVASVLNYVEGAIDSASNSETVAGIDQRIQDTREHPTTKKVVEEATGFGDNVSKFARRAASDISETATETYESAKNMVTGAPETKDAAAPKGDKPQTDKPEGSDDDKAKEPGFMDTVGQLAKDNGIGAFSSVISMIIGWMVGGPVGAIIGGLIGLFAGSHFGDRENGFVHKYANPKEPEKDGKDGASEELAKGKEREKALEAGAEANQAAKDAKKDKVAKNQDGSKNATVSAGDASLAGIASRAVNAVQMDPETLRSAGTTALNVANSVGMALTTGALPMLQGAKNEPGESKGRE